MSKAGGEIKKHTSKPIIKSIQEEPESRKESLLFMFERAAKRHKRNKQLQFWTHENPISSGIVEKTKGYLYLVFGRKPCARVVFYFANLPDFNSKTIQKIIELHGSLQTPIRQISEKV